MTKSIIFLDEVASGEHELKKQNEALINQAKVLNQTILRLEKEKLELKSELAANVVELYSWYNNYTQLSSLLLQYNQRLKLISQLYRDTAYALNKCQDEKSSKWVHFCLFSHGRPKGSQGAVIEAKLNRIGQNSIRRW